MGKLIIDNTEKFTKSSCKCTLCSEFNNKSYFVPKNNVEKRLLYVIKNIEKREKRKEKITII